MMMLMVLMMLMMMVVMMMLMMVMMMVLMMINRTNPHQIFVKDPRTMADRSGTPQRHRHDVPHISAISFFLPKHYCYFIIRRESMSMATMTYFLDTN